jgi:hypothetical protein
VDPKAEAFYGWSGYNSNLDNPILNKDPLGDAPWFKNDADKIMWSNKQVDEIVDENSTRWKNIGETFTTSDNNGNVIEGDAAGNVSVVLPEATISADANENSLDEKAETITNATGAVVDITESLVKLAGEASESMAKHSSYLNVAKTIKGMGTGLGVIGLGMSIIEAYNEPTPGNVLNALWDAGIMFTGPVGGLADAAFDASGLKDKMFEGIDTLYENTQKQTKKEQKK